MEAFEFILETLDKLIIDRAFNKKMSFKRRWPYVFIYYIVLILLLSLTTFLGINYIKVKNVMGYFLILLSLIFFILLILPSIVYKNK